MHADFPTNETLAALIDGRLDPRARSRVEQHLTGCDECYAMVADVSAAREAIGEAAFEPPVPEQGRDRVVPFRTFAIAAALAAGVAAVIFAPPLEEAVPRLRLPGGGVLPKPGIEVLARMTGFFGAIHESIPVLRSPDIEELAKVADAKRVSRTRIAAIPDYREAAPVMRGGDDDRGENYYALMATTDKIQQAASKHPTRRNLHSLGVALLLDKKPADAIAALEKAAALGKPDAELLNDLSAAYTDRITRVGRRPDDGKAVEYADQALQLEKNPASAWNRALALEFLDRTAEAKTAWQQYLQLERDRAWKDEAQRRLDDLNELTAPR